MASCQAVLVVIGDEWLNARFATGERRLDSPTDFVRLEIAAALDRDILVVPVLVEGATMPGPNDLPPDIARLARCNAVEMNEPGWGFGMSRLVKVLEGRVQRSRDVRRWLRLAVPVVVVGLAIGLVLQLLPDQDAVTAPAPRASLDAFWVEADGAIGTTWARPGADGGKWQPAFRITPPGATRVGSGVAALTRFDGVVDVFWVGPDGAIGSAWAERGNDEGKWRAAFPITPPGVARGDSAVAAVARFGGDDLNVFWVTPDGAIATAWSSREVENGAWQRPFPITRPGAARADTVVAAVMRFDELHVFWVGTDGAVFTVWTSPGFDDDKWQPPFPITQPGATRHDSVVAAVARFDGELDVFWAAPDGAIATVWTKPGLDDNRWQPAFPISQPGAARAGSAVTAVSRLDGALDVFWVGSAGAITTTGTPPGVQPGRWQERPPITRAGVARNDSALAAVTHRDGGLNAFWIGQQGAISTTGARPGTDNGSWQRSSRITTHGAARSTSALTVVAA